MAKKNTDPERMCAACRQKKPRSELFRIVSKDGILRYDPTGKQDGRGIYVCRRKSCVERLRKLKNVAGRGRMPEDVLAQLEQQDDFNG